MINEKIKQKKKLVPIDQTALKNGITCKDIDCEFYKVWTENETNCCLDYITRFKLCPHLKDIKPKKELKESFITRITCPYCGTDIQPVYPPLEPVQCDPKGNPNAWERVGDVDFIYFCDDCDIFMHYSRFNKILLSDILEVENK